jgi:hypothetical protein
MYLPFSNTNLSLRTSNILSGTTMTLLPSASLRTKAGGVRFKSFLMQRPGTAFNFFKTSVAEIIAMDSLAMVRDREATALQATRYLYATVEHMAGLCHVG